MRKHVEKFLALQYRSSKEKLKTFVRTRPFLAGAILLVLVFHLSLFTYTLFKKTYKKLPAPKKLIVKTFVMPETKITEKVITKSVIPKTKKVTIPIKKVKRTQQVKKTKKIVQVKKPTDKRKKLIQDLQTSIAKIETKQLNTATAAVTIPKPISELKANHYEIKTETKLSDGEESVAHYTNLLVSHLKDTLSLPGYGTVKLKLTLNSSGIIENMIVSASDSEVNRMYLEKHLSDLFFPKFTDELAGKKSHTFSLTFCSN
ncbi:hypothetical protein COB11_05810 [Candidatus Aerophobetes bacterium]|uniref:Uncharacterized protein n=1 Tax=Aerophobetes bacterium TaxID=2030807 RepID=A0A2A4YE76_UNCAE|nr:MAG: hypothetical protein COB11_05810 [Candidatus Aerophobetes bacterium]